MNDFEHSIYKMPVYSPTTYTPNANLVEKPKCCFLPVKAILYAYSFIFSVVWTVMWIDSDWWSTWKTCWTIMLVLELIFFAGTYIESTRIIIAHLIYQVFMLFIPVVLFIVIILAWMIGSEIPLVSQMNPKNIDEAALLFCIFLFVFCLSGIVRGELTWRALNYSFEVQVFRNGSKLRGYVRNFAAGRLNGETDNYPSEDAFDCTRKPRRGGPTTKQMINSVDSSSPKVVQVNETQKTFTSIYPSI